VSASRSHSFARSRIAASEVFWLPASCAPLWSKGEGREHETGVSQPRPPANSPDGVASLRKVCALHNQEADVSGLSGLGSCRRRRWPPKPRLGWLAGAVCRGRRSPADRPPRRVNSSPARRATDTVPGRRPICANYPQAFPPTCSLSCEYLMAVMLLPPVVERLAVATIDERGSQ
jgi:hypothetical protein